MNHLRSPKMQSKDHSSVLCGVMFGVVLHLYHISYMCYLFICNDNRFNIISTRESDVPFDFP